MSKHLMRIDHRYLSLVRLDYISNTFLSKPIKRIKIPCFNFYRNVYKHWALTYPYDRGKHSQALVLPEEYLILAFQLTIKNEAMSKD